ncbi:MAG: DMT family transporter [Proteobacteria bacterium]|nr:DMT family transporter [Pseudomonadota bacterium]
MKTKDLLAMTGLAAIWGASFLFLRLATPALGPVSVAAGRVGLAALLLWPLVWRQGHGPAMRQRAWPLAVSALLACVLPFLAMSQAARTLPAGLMSILNAVTPMWGALVGWLWGGERLGRTRAIGLLVGLAGVALLSADASQLLPAQDWPQTLLACALMMLGTLLYATSVHYNQRHLRGLAPMAVSAGTMAWGAACLLGPALWLGPPDTLQEASRSAWLTRWAEVPALAWWSLAGLGALCTALAYVLFFRLIQRIGPSQALTVTFLIPVFGMLWGALLLGETITPTMLLATGVIAWGTWLSNRGPAVPPVRT